MRRGRARNKGASDGAGVGARGREGAAGTAVGARDADVTAYSELLCSIRSGRLTHDEWMLQLYGADPSPEQFQVFYDRVSERIEALWTRCVALGLDVVLDLNFWSRKQRDEVRSTAAMLGASVQLYRLSCTDVEAWARIEQRNRALTDSLFIARNTFEVLRNRFEPLDDDEARIEVSA